MQYKPGDKVLILENPWTQTHNNKLFIRGDVGIIVSYNEREICVYHINEQYSAHKAYAYFNHNHVISPWTFDEDLKAIIND